MDTRRLLALWMCKSAAWLRRAVVLPRSQAEIPAPGSRAFLLLYLPLLSIGLVILSFCAPFIPVDGSVLASTDMNDFVVPHFPPLYPLFLRSINAIVHNASVVMGSSASGEGYRWSLYRPAPYSNASIYAAIVVQHALLAAAASWFAVSMASGWWLRIGTAFVLCWSPPILAATQRIQTEGLWNPLVIAAVAFGGRFLLDGRRPFRSLALHFLCLGLSALVRHPGTVFLAVMPLALASLGIVEAFRKRRLGATLPFARSAFVIGCMGLVTLSVVSLVKTAVLVACDVVPRSVYGRAGTMRIHPQALGRFEGMTEEDLDEVLVGLEQRADDPRVRRAIRLIATSDSVWTGAFIRVRSEIVEPAFPEYTWKQKTAETDYLLNKVARLVQTSTDPRMIKNVALRALRFLQIGRGMGAGPLRAYMDKAVGVADWVWLGEDQLAKVTAARNVGKLRRTMVLEWATLFFRPKEGRLLWFSIAVLSLLALARGRFGRRASLGVAVAASAVIYALLMAVATFYSNRYAEIVILLEACGCALLLSELVERESNDERAAGQS